jgi:NagD protein
MMQDKRSYQKSFIMDMDGVVYTGSRLIPGAKEFVGRLIQGNYKFLFLTNNSYYTRPELRDRLLNMGIEVDEDCFYTSAMATASFLQGAAAEWLLRLCDWRQGPSGGT